MPAWTKLPTGTLWAGWLAVLTDQQILALTAWAEARGDWREGNSSLEERVAVMQVIRTRVRKRRQDIRKVCLAPLQFSCWNRVPDGNHLALVEQVDHLVNGGPVDPILAETLFLAGGVLAGHILEQVKGSDHYYAPKGMVPKGSAPTWAFRDGQLLPPTVIVGEQHFYKL